MKKENDLQRDLCHSRNVFSQGFRRNDKLYDIVSTIIDTKSYDFKKYDGNTLSSGEPLHEMEVCLTIDINMKIHDINAKTVSSPYQICKFANLNVRKLIGEVIGPGWKNKINSLIGGSEGCTHVRELMVAMATVAFQTIYGEKARMKREALLKGEVNPLPSKDGPPNLLNSCYAYDQSSEITKEFWPKYWNKKN